MLITLIIPLKQKKKKTLVGFHRITDFQFDVFPCKFVYPNPPWMQTIFQKAKNNLITLKIEVCDGIALKWTFAV